MIVGKGHALEYLEQYRTNNIAQGLGIGCAMDEFFVHKWSQLNFVLGHDNVGKSYWGVWYMTCLASNYGIKTCLFMDENHYGKVYKDIVRFLAGVDIRDISKTDLAKYTAWVDHHFPCIDNTKQYNHLELLESFEASGADILFIDPYNALRMEFTYQNNYLVLNYFKAYLKGKQKSIYIPAHPTSSSGRRTAEYPKEHQWAGYVMPPLRADIEGGRAFTAKADDFLVLHRMTDNPSFKHTTMLYVSKIKDTDSGGKPTNKDIPVMLDYNFGNGFTVNGVNPIKKL